MIANIDPIAGKAGKAEKESPDYKNLVDLLAVLSETHNRLDALQTAVNEATLELVDEHNTEAALEIIARKHPEWFAKKKSLTTPYGSVALKTNPPKLEVKNEELSIVLIEQEAERNREFNAAAFIETKKVLRLDVLSGEDDDTLAKFRIKRVQGSTFSAKPATLNLGEAVKEDSVAK
jgi:hypothetical protein